MTLAHVLLRAGEQAAAVQAVDEGLAVATSDVARTRLVAVRERALRTRPTGAQL